MIMIRKLLSHWSKTANRQKKGKNEPKEQRKPRTPRTQANLPLEKKTESEKVSDKPEFQEPGPEFYKNLKRETDEILKITEESNAKYSKKTIHSNWKKYEAPIETYEEREEVENMGADFEQLVNAPISSGGHFQFKHEKSWGTAIEASQYDKYFEIDMAQLAISLSTIPFYERNDIDVKIFSQSDITAMDHRAKKFKDKYQLKHTQLIEEDIVDSTKFNNLAITMKQNEHVLKKEELVIEGTIENDDFAIDFSKDTQGCDDLEIKQVSDTKETESSENLAHENDTVMLENKNKDLYGDDLNKLLLMDEDILTNKGKDNPAGFGSAKIPKAHINVSSTEATEQESEEDLEEWLDDILSK